MGLVYSISACPISWDKHRGELPLTAMGRDSIVTFAVFFWSVFTGLTAMVWNLTSLLAVRFTFGALESALSPSIASAFNRWVPVNNEPPLSAPSWAVEDSAAQSRLQLPALFCFITGGEFHSLFSEPSGLLARRFGSGGIAIRRKTTRVSRKRNSNG